MTCSARVIFSFWKMLCVKTEFANYSCLETQDREYTSKVIIASLPKIGNTV